jgi:hypothetical protein
MNPGPFRPRVQPLVDQPLKHVIETYRHQAQEVTCVCGWHGSTAGDFGGPSPWTLHVRQFKTARR